jgi:FKBP-type peptidyl-prolyl cis-trans isomerase 2
MYVISRIIRGLPGVVAWMAVAVASAAGELVVAPDHAITIEYTLTLPDATVVASSATGDPIEYVHGRNQLLTALEDGLNGMKVGQRKRIEIAPENAYGAYDEKNRMTVERGQLPADVKVGAKLLSSDERPVVVLELTEKTAVLDTNHPMAGKTLVFDVEIAKIAVAPPESAGNGAEKSKP